MEEEYFRKILTKQVKEEKDVSEGKIMSATGIKFKKKFFAFYYKNEIVLKLGKDFDFESMGIRKCKNLNPFINKPPMKNWYRIPFSEKRNWEKLSKIALDFVMEESKNKD